MSPEFIGLVTKVDNGEDSQICIVTPLADQSGRPISNFAGSPFRGPLYVPDGEKLVSGEFVSFEKFKPSRGIYDGKFPHMIWSRDIRSLQQTLYEVLHVENLSWRRLKRTGVVKIDLPFQTTLPKPQCVWRIQNKIIGPFDHMQNNTEFVFWPSVELAVFECDVPDMELMELPFLDKNNNNAEKRFFYRKSDHFALIKRLGEGAKIVLTNLAALEQSEELEQRLHKEYLQPELDRLAKREAKIENELAKQKAVIEDRLAKREVNLEKQLAKQKVEIDKREKQLNHYVKIAREYLTINDNQDVIANIKPKGKQEQWLTERDFLEDAYQYIATSPYVFERDLVYNFWNCLKSNYLTVLAGISGSGKSKLPQLLARAIGGVARVIPVRPNWHDGEDILGFYNPMLYRYQSTPFLDALLEARWDSDRLWIIVLDEMNLAPVEHYFSEFLSLLEQGETAELNLNGWNRQTWLQARHYWESKKDEAELSNIDRLKLPFRMPDNVRFVGTINIDHTTHMLSDKLLDRANIIQFNRANLQNLNIVQRLTRANEDVSSPQMLSVRQYREFARLKPPTSQQANRLAPYSDHLRKVNDILTTSGLNFGFRVFTAIEDYLLYIIQGEEYLDLETAYDLQLKQRILPKIRGIRTANNHLQDTLENLANALQAYPQSQAKVEQLKQQLAQGYMNYWETR